MSRYFSCFSPRSQGRALGDVVYYFTERKEDQSLTEPAKKGRGNGFEHTREEAPVSKDMGQQKGTRRKEKRIMEYWNDGMME
jgi:hypothetical protein